MTTSIGIGRSSRRDPRQAAHEAVEQALRMARVSVPDFVLCFATVGYDQQAVVTAVREASGGAPLAGCSAEGVLVQDEPNESNFALAVMAFSSDEMRFEHGLAVGLKADSRGVGRSIAQDIRATGGDDGRMLFVFPDGLTVDFDGLQQGIEEGLARTDPLPLVGGTAADNWMWERTHQYCDDQVTSDGVAWVMLSGSVQLATAVNHGCVSLGVDHEITRSEGTTIYEIDGRRALDVMHEYMTPEEMLDWGSASVNLPLCFETPSEMQGYDDYVVRIMQTRDEETGAVTIPTQTKPGTRMYLARRDFAKVFDGVDRLASDLRDGLHGKTPLVVFQFECAGRGKTFLRDEQKIQLVRKLHDQIPATSWFGFYTYGEVGPVGRQNFFHNYTSVLAALY